MHDPLASSSLTTTAAHILLVEDERQIARFIELELRHEGYRVSVASNGVEALIAARETAPDLLVLDLMIAGVDGLEVCRRLRARTPQAQAVPIIMLTARDAVADRVLGLQLGADDYLTKPFAIEELLARIAALLRRAAPHSSAGTRLTLADLVVDTGGRVVTRGSRVVELTAKEYDLLVFLLRHPQQVLSRSQIADAVWGPEAAGESNIIDVYVGYLRAKLDDAGARLIHTVRGVGYVLREG